MKKLVCLLFATALFLPAAALAGPKNGQDAGNARQHKGQRVKFEDCDKDQTGSLDFAEAQQCYRKMTRARFDAIDANKDGAITKDEMKAARAAHKKGQKGQRASQ
jgi:Ca2+-binding EF-hand superfamily protein